MYLQKGFQEKAEDNKKMGHITKRPSERSYV